MIFKEGVPLYSTEIERKEGEDVAYVNYLQANFVPLISDRPDVMAKAIDVLIDNPKVSRIVFVQQKNYHYSFEQVSLLQETARLLTFFLKSEEILSPSKLQIFGNIAQVHAELSYFLGLLKMDPIACYRELKNSIRRFRADLDTGNVVNTSALINYLRLLERFQNLLEATKLIQNCLKNIGDYHIGDREIYRDFFRPDVLPNFTFTRLVAQLPPNAKLIDQYVLEYDEEWQTCPQN